MNTTEQTPLFEGVALIDSVNGYAEPEEWYDNHGQGD
jgi:hypothetical protein